MDIRNQIASPPKRLALPAPKPKNELANTEKPSLAQDLFEKTAGVASAALRIPTNLVSGTLVGGFHGFRKGLDPNYKISTTGTAVGQVAVNTAQGQLNAAVTGFMVGGPVGMAANMTMDAMAAGAGIYVFVKNGSAQEVGKQLSEAIDQNVKPGEGGFKGFVKGVAAGSVRSVKAAAITGFREGKGMAAGITEGANAVKRQVKVTTPPKGSLLKAVTRSAWGAVNSVLALPAGVVLPLLTKNAPEKLAQRLAISSASGAVMGATLGALAGPPGMAIGASVGSLLGLASPASSKAFSRRVLTTASLTKKRSRDLGSDISNNNRDMWSTAIAGGTSAMSNAWNLSFANSEKQAIKSEKS